MKDTTATGNYYTIGHVAQCTGLTDRTIRSYIASGLLKGEKINGLWHFTGEQVEAFIRHPAVYPSIRTKQNGKLFDFLLDTQKKTQQACVILDLPGEEPREVSEFFCYTITEGNFHGLQFSFDGCQKTPRVILTGDTREVWRLVNAYYGERLGT